METVLIAVGALLFFLVFAIVVRAGEHVKEHGRLTPEQERAFELDQPVYAFATITSENCEEVIAAEILHVQDPERYPSVPAIEARKKELETHASDESI